MNTKEYLGQINRYDTMIKNGLDEVVRYRNMAVSITKIIDSDKVQSTPDPDRLGKAIDRVVDLEREIDSLIQQYIIARNTIVGQLNGISNTRHYDLLYKVYVLGKDLYETADEMGKSYGYIKHLHSDALNDFASKYKKSYAKVKNITIKH